jgi:branched-chain amino acid transport system ATP-binding protein
LLQTSRLLQTSALRAGYGRSEVLHGIDLSIAAGEVVVVLGPNGAGKTTLMRSIAGLLPPRSGTITFLGTNVTGQSAAQAVRRGIMLVPEGRHIFKSMSVEENLLMGAYSRNGRAAIAEDIDRMYSHFPVLARKRADKGGAMSGGEQQMLAVARGLMARPRLLLLDEPSLGLAPRLVGELAALIRRVVAEFETSVLLVEQNASVALDVAVRGYVLHSGRVELEAPAEEIRQVLLRDNLYLGGHAITPAGRGQAESSG